MWLCVELDYIKYKYCIRAHVCITLLTHTQVQRSSHRNQLSNGIMYTYILIRCRPLSPSLSLSLSFSFSPRSMLYWTQCCRGIYWAVCIHLLHPIHIKRVCAIFYINRSIGCWLNGYLAQSELIACASIRSTAQQAIQTCIQRKIDESWCSTFALDINNDLFIFSLSLYLSLSSSRSFWSKPRQNR